MDIVQEAMKKGGKAYIIDSFRVANTDLVVELEYDSKYGNKYWVNCHRENIIFGKHRNFLTKFFAFRYYIKLKSKYEVKNDV